MPQDILTSGLPKRPLQSWHFIDPNFGVSCIVGITCCIPNFHRKHAWVAPVMQFPAVLYCTFRVFSFIEVLYIYRCLIPPPILKMIMLNRKPPETRNLATNSELLQVAPARPLETRVLYRRLEVCLELSEQSGTTHLGQSMRHRYLHVNICERLTHLYIYKYNYT